jgi:hypothetical protein
MHCKITSFILLSLLSATILHAQLKKGDKMAGASVASAFFNSGTSDQTVTSIGSVTAKVTGYGLSISPEIGWFISGKTAVGAVLNINPNGEKASYQGSNGNTFQQNKTNNFNIGIGGFVRHYLNSDGTFMPFGQIGLNGGISTATVEKFFYGGSGATVYKETENGKSSGGIFVNSTFRLGLTKMVGEHTGLDIFLGYNFNYSKNTFKNTKLRDDGNNGSIDTRSENETLTKFTNHGVILGLGFQVFLRGKK